MRFVLALLAALLAAPACAHAIVGGTTATTDYPHMAAMEFRGDDGQWSFICGASLVRTDVVLTAAHCVQDDPDTDGREDDAARYRFLIGTRDRARGGERIVAARLVDHPQYDPASGAYDVAMLGLERTTSLGAPIRVAGPGDAAQFEPGDEAVVLGWGATFSGGPPERELREGRVPVVSDATCERGYTVTADFDPPTMLCAGNATGGEDSCQGDSGGPLMVPDAGSRLILIGDVSFGVGCAFPTQYGVYGEVAGDALRPWVEARAGELSATGAPPPPPGSGPAAPPEPGGGTETGSLTDRVNRIRIRTRSRLRVVVRTSRPLRRVRLVVRRGGKVVATGRRSALRRRATVRLRRRAGLRAGRAKLTLTARDADGGRLRVVRRIRLRR